MATHSSTLALNIPWAEEPDGLTVHGVAKSQTRLSHIQSGIVISISVSISTFLTLYILKHSLFSHKCYINCINFSNYFSCSGITVCIKHKK